MVYISRFQKDKKNTLYLHLQFPNIHVLITFLFTVTELVSQSYWLLFRLSLAVWFLNTFPERKIFSNHGSIAAVPTFKLASEDFSWHRTIRHRSLATPALMTSIKTLQMIAPHRQVVSVCLEIIPWMWVFVSLADCSLGSLSRRSAVLFISLTMTHLEGDLETISKGKLCVIILILLYKPDCSLSVSCHAVLSPVLEWMTQ